MYMLQVVVRSLLTLISLAVKVPCIVESNRPDSCPGFGTGARTFLNLIQNLTSAILSMVDDVPVDSDVLVMTSSILRPSGSVF